MLQLLCSLRRTLGILVKLSTNWSIHIQDIQSFRTITYPLKIFKIVSYTKSLRGPRSGWAELAEPWRGSGPLYSVNVTTKVMKLSTYNSQFEKNFVFEYQITQRPLDKEPGPGRARRALVYSLRSSIWSWIRYLCGIESVLWENERSTDQGMFPAHTGSEHGV